MVITHAALHKDFFSHLPVSFDAVGVVHADGIDQPGNNILMRYAFVNGILDIRRDKCGALVVEVRRALSFHCNIRDVFHGHIQRFQRRLFKK